MTSYELIFYLMVLLLSKEDKNNKDNWVEALHKKQSRCNYSVLFVMSLTGYELNFLL